MKISIIITTKNEEFNLKRLLESMLKIKENVEVIVVDAGSTDKTEEVGRGGYGLNPFLTTEFGIPSVG